MDTCVKLLGSDFELANALESPQSRRGQPEEAARRLLAQIPGFPRSGYGGSALEWGRRFLPGNGGSAYIDSDHLEINLPEHLRASDHAALVLAGLQIARDAQLKANEELAERGARINVTANVSDGHESWGHHLNLMVTRRFFDELFLSRPQLSGFLAAHLATSLVYTGQGHVGASNRRPACKYQISQRADWFETFMALQTTHNRPLLNLRDEPHARKKFARLHLIFFDPALMPIANYLMAGATQLVVAMAEAGWIDVGVLLDDPLSACHAVSRDLTLGERLPLAARGKHASAVEIQSRLAELAGEFIAAGLAEAVVPGAAEIVRIWQETLAMVRERELGALARRCDWALKLLLLERQRGRKQLGWDSPELKYLDHRYASLDPEEGMFFQLAAAGKIDALPTPGEIQRFVDEPPEETRAWLRAHVLRRFGDRVSHVDWGRMRFRLGGGAYWRSDAVLSMPDPTAFNRQATEATLARITDLSELLEALGTKEEDDGAAYGWGGSYYAPGASSSHDSNGASMAAWDDYWR